MDITPIMENQMKWAPGREYRVAYRDYSFMFSDILGLPMELVAVFYSSGRVFLMGS